MPRVLFLCTGNHYRSRFAEHLFNHLAPTLCPAWEATSRGLAIERGINNVGPINREAVDMLGVLGVELPDAHRAPAPLTTFDLVTSDYVVALKTAEHRPLLEERFAEWSAENGGQVLYWDVHDVEDLAPAAALPLIADHVGALARGLHEVGPRWRPNAR